MLSLYEILKASKTGIAPDMWTALAGMNWSGKDSGAEVKELTGIPPLSIRSNGTMLLDYLISGNMSQTGTLTSTTPIQPQETGERTGNLVEVSNSNCIIYSAYNQFTITNDIINITGNALFGFIVKCSPNAQYTVSSTRTGYNCDMRIREYSEKPSDWTNDFITQSVNVGSATGSASFTTNSATKYILVCFYGSNTARVSNIMLNTGSTALPYEPYGIKIPISSANTTTPVYLGEVETTRKIKKLVLTGQESGFVSIGITNHIHSIRGIFNSEPELMQVGGVCTHYKYNNVVSSLATNMQNGDFVLNKIVNDYSFTIKDNSFNIAADFKNYLRQQYANGTPVTIWYILANETTGIVNEPLRKIGDYADTVSYEQAGVQIPTNRGNTVIDVQTELKPSEMYIKYQG